MIAWRPLAILVGCVLFLAVLVVGSGMMTGLDGLREMWREIRVYVIAGGLITVLALASLVAIVVARLRARKQRDMARYELVLGQADEATHDEVAAAAEALVQALRSTLVERVAGGQPWLAIESWHVPPTTAGETGNALLMILCEPAMLESALAALRRAYPNLTVRCASETGEPVRYDAPRFEPAHVLRVRKARDWALPVGGSSGSSDHSNARSVMATVIRQQQKVGNDGLVSCVRWCLLPADESVDSLAARRLRRLAREHGASELGGQRRRRRGAAQRRRRAVLRRAAISDPAHSTARRRPLRRSAGRVSAARQPGAVDARRQHVRRTSDGHPPEALPAPLGTSHAARAARIRRARRCGSPASSGCSSSCRRWAASTTFRWPATPCRTCPRPRRFRAASTAGYRCHPALNEHARGFRTTMEVPAEDEEVLVGELVGEDA